MDIPEVTPYRPVRRESPSVTIKIAAERKRRNLLLAGGAGLVVLVAGFLIFRKRRQIQDRAVVVTEHRRRNVPPHISDAFINTGLTVGKEEEDPLRAVVYSCFDCDVADDMCVLPDGTMVEPPCPANVIRVEPVCPAGKTAKVQDIVTWCCSKERAPSPFPCPGEEGGGSI